MDASEIDAYCISFSGAQKSHPFGAGVTCWSVDGRFFAMMAEGSDQVSLKCADEKTAQMLVDHGRAGKLPHLPHGGWIAVKLDGADEGFDLKSRLRDSYNMARAAAR